MDSPEFFDASIADIETLKTVKALEAFRGAATVQLLLTGSEKLDDDTVARVTKQYGTSSEETDPLVRMGERLALFDVESLAAGTGTGEAYNG